VEALLRKLFATSGRRGRYLAGVVFTFVIVSIIIGVSSTLVKVADSTNKILGLMVSAILIYTTLSIKDLKDESMSVVRALSRSDIKMARKKLSLIVGRDTENLNEKEIIRAAVETVAENTVDGIISPLFYAFLGGAPLALAYKAINTMDSMVGYNNVQYRDFGWASAKLDDLANFIPARVSALLLPIASFLTGKSGSNCWRIIWRDRKKNPSPNSGIPEAAIAGALNIQLGGVNLYNSVVSLKPFIGNDINPLETDHIKQSVKISYVCSLLMLISGLFLIQIL
jgi:adenosylcobinamide-phosphate synthase